MAGVTVLILLSTLLSMKASAAAAAGRLREAHLCLCLRNTAYGYLMTASAAAGRTRPSHMENLRNALSTTHDSSSAPLSVDYYASSCPRLGGIVADRVAAALYSNITIGASLFRLLFHDCFVRGCDASILLHSSRTRQAEKEAAPNRSVRGYAVIDDIKQHLEAVCPGIVSCADIVALAAAESVKQGHVRTMRLGRRDGRYSNASEASAFPSSHALVPKLLTDLGSMGLGVADLVALSGAHTIVGVGCARDSALDLTPLTTLWIHPREAYYNSSVGATTSTPTSY